MSSLKSTLWSSEARVNSIPPQCLKKSVMVGIDEAGRGPVIGPMVYGAAFWCEEENDEISKLGFDDSKALTAEQREKLKESIDQCESIGYVTRILSAEEISANMLQKYPYNLNIMSHSAAIQMIQTILDQGVQVSKVFVDTVGDPKKYQEKLTKHFHETIQFTVSKKADALFKCVSAASIVAKVTRDHLIEEIHTKLVQSHETKDPKDEIGSGYPSDPTTKKWLADHLHPVFGYPSFVRFSWSTIVEILKKPQAKRVLWEEDMEDTPAPKKKKENKIQYKSVFLDRRNIKRAPLF